MDVLKQIAGKGSEHVRHQVTQSALDVLKQIPQAIQQQRKKSSK